MGKYTRTVIEKGYAFIRSNNREMFHVDYRRMYRLGYRREASFYVNLLIYKEFWVKMKFDG